ncbi:hypothetical protein F5Y12DRAFT_48107 [Xylaria sp. FL1777]|nr:hypothetical protein F5Y12DRAFT_48107 [Xylaria sp. FL1777]
MPARDLIIGGVPALPRIFAYTVILILFLSTVILGLAAYAESLSGNYYYESGVSRFLIFVSIWTLFFYGGVFALAKYAPRFYSRIGVLIGHLLSVIFWISAWTWAISWATYILSFDNYDSYDSIRGSWKAFGQVTLASAAIGSLVWGLCITAFGFFCTACVRGSSSIRVNNFELVDPSDPSKPNVPQGQTTSPPS